MDTRVRMRTVTTGGHGSKECRREYVVENSDRKRCLQRFRNRGDSKI